MTPSEPHLSLTVEQFQESLLYAVAGGIVLLFCLFVIARSVTFWRRGIQEGTPIVGEGLERLKKRGEIP